MNSHEPMEVYAARDEIDATLVQSMLAESGIEARVVGGQIAGAVGEVPAGLPSAPRVWVSSNNADVARTLIREMEAKRQQSWQKDRQAIDSDEQRQSPSQGKQIATAGALGVVPDAYQHSQRGNEQVADDEVWECAQCHEHVTVDFEICWNCQEPKNTGEE